MLVLYFIKAQDPESAMNLSSVLTNNQLLGFYNATSSFDCMQMCNQNQNCTNLWYTFYRESYFLNCILLHGNSTLKANSNYFYIKGI